MSIVDDIRSETDERMKKTIESLKSDLSRVRTGRATPVLLDGIKVDYYGSQMPISQVATISVPDARTIAIQPWEKTMVAPIEKSIMASDLGLNPQNDGTIIRLPIPPLSEDRRKDLVKNSKKVGEDKKVAIRNIRRDANDQLKKAEKAKEVTQDEQKKEMETIQKMTDDYIKRIDENITAKEAEIMDN